MARIRAAKWIPIVTLLATSSCGGDSPTDVDDPEAFAGCSDVTAHSIGGSTIGNLNGGSCVYLNDPTDFYEFRLTQSRTVTIQLSSSAFDAWLFLFDRTTGGVLAFDDDSGGGLNASIQENLTAGTYVIGATSFDGGTGGYTLTTSQ
jgi:hypothetical protein